jgi:hypothetical protein
MVPHQWKRVSPQSIRELTLTLNNPLARRHSTN